MNINSVPTSEEVGKACTKHSLAVLLVDAMDGMRVFTHSESITGVAVTSRLFTNHPLPNATELDPPLNHITATDHLFLLISTGQARYAPTHAPGAVKGWQVRHALISGHRCVIVRACWVTPT